MISIATNDELKMHYIATKIANNKFYKEVMDELQSAVTQGKKSTKKFEWGKLDKSFDPEEFCEIFSDGLGYSIFIKNRKVTLEYFKIAKMDSADFYLSINL